eukprot:TRINITY_DN50030_c0_g1_i3.p1 TRINITY_DN50030_c0_g1~~TRINITY_DN50030_c0_g1_i3.p1  ORF type:complete len:190 (+),score=15.25 TRINITY_DN50030_c0_g1_i3:190-759(+)
MQISEDLWVPAPPNTEGPPTLRNLAKIAEGVALRVIGGNRPFCQEHEKLLNLLRLGSKVGEPLYFTKPASVRGGMDGRPRLILDFGRTVTVQRVGATCSGTDNHTDWFEVWSTAHDLDTLDDDMWEPWGRASTAERPGMFFLDRCPTRARFLRIAASSGRIPGGKVHHLFAYGYDEPDNNVDALVQAAQ